MEELWKRFMSRIDARFDKMDARFDKVEQDINDLREEVCHNQYRVFKPKDR